MKKALRACRRNDGATYILFCFILLGICMIWVTLMYYLMGVSVARAQRSSSEQILDQYVQNNAVWIYGALKEHDDTTDALLTERYVQYLTLQQGLTQAADGRYCSYAADNSVRYFIEDVKLEFLQANTPRLALTYTLHYPLQILGQICWVEIPACAYSRLHAKTD